MSQTQVNFFQLFFCLNLYILLCHNFFILLFITLFFRAFLSHAAHRTLVLPLLSRTRFHFTSGPHTPSKFVHNPAIKASDLTHFGVSSDSVEGVSFHFFFRDSNSLRLGSGSLWMSSHLGTKVPRGFNTEFSPEGAHWS